MRSSSACAMLLLMPARCVPAEPAFNDTGAEEIVWRALRDALPDTALLVHGCVLHFDGRQGELDLVAFVPGAGVLTVEVKGGAVSRTPQGWIQNGHEIKSPVQQVSRAHFALRDWIRNRNVGVGRAQWQWCVAFPQRDWTEPDAPDLPRRLVLDKNALAGDVRKWVKAALAETDGEGLRTDSVALLDHVFAPGASQSELLAATARERAQVLETLTQAQAKILRLFRDNPRLLVVGGAGSGKTFLALERAREQARAGLRVALVCYSRGLGRYLQRRVDQLPLEERPAWVGLFHDLPQEWGAEPEFEPIGDYYERFLPAELVRLAPEQELFDAVVVDEAQDFGEGWWDSVMAILRGPRCLTVFQDEGQRIFPREAQLPVEMAHVSLPENVRNTREIAATFAGMTPDGHQDLLGPAGPAVDWRPCPADEALGLADDAVDELLEEWEEGQIALLTVGHRHGLQHEALEFGGWKGYWDDFFQGDSIFYGHVRGFKGLERDAVVLCLNGFKDVRARELLYVGLSRARQRLIVVGELPDGLM